MDHIHQTTELFVPWVALMLGLGGSLAHCVGMCSSITLLFARRGVTSTAQTTVLHIGRITTYTVLGLAAGAFGMGLEALLPDIQLVQGGLALGLALLAIYLAASIMGLVPSPERVFTVITRWWGQTMRTIQTGKSEAQSPALMKTFGYGLLWGMLPCGFVLTALLAATSSGSAAAGAAAMLAFGLGTWPALLVTQWIGQRNISLHQPWMRSVTALVVVAFGAQLALRGLAAWGWVDHMTLGTVMIW